MKKYRAKNEKEILQRWGDYQAQLYEVTQAEQRELESRELYEQARYRQKEAPNDADVHRMKALLSKIKNRT